MVEDGGKDQLQHYVEGHLREEDLQIGDKGDLQLTTELQTGVHQREGLSRGAHSGQQAEIGQLLPNLLKLSLVKLVREVDDGLIVHI